MHKRPLGFTIVELLVVIVVIGVLASISLIAYTGISNKAKEASVISDLDNTNKQFKLFQVENSGYPSTIDCAQPNSTTNKCIKLSGDNTLGAYNVDNTATPQTFCLTIKNGSNITKNITHDGVITDGACTYAFPVTIAANSPAPTADTIYLSWPTITGTIDSYTLERATDSGFTANLTTLTPPAPSATTYTSSGLTSATTYYYRLKVTMSGDTSNWSNVATNSTKATLTITAGANGTVNTAVNGDYTIGSTPTITATSNSGYIFNNWTGSTGCNNITTASFAITMDSSKTCTANFVVDPWAADWYNGIAATALAGKHIRKTDLSGTYQYKTSDTAVASPQGATGLDPNYPSNMSLVSPQTNTGVDFSAYPAQNACKAIGGRLPNMQELNAIYAGKASYGNNFQAAPYWSSTEYNYDSSFSYSVYFVSGASANDYKTGTYYVRCVSG